MGKPKAEITPDEIKGALKTSGFPFEIKLLDAFDAGGMDPTIGFRLRVTDGPLRLSTKGDDVGESSLTREVDVLAQLAEFVPVPQPSGDSRVVGIHLAAFIEAKGLDIDCAFVGFTWKRPTSQQARSLRSVFGGAPSFGVLNEFPGPMDLAVGTNGIAPSLDVLNAAPFCVQWAVARVGSSDHEDRLWRSMDNLVRGMQRHGEESSLHMLRSPDTSARLNFDLPTLILRTKTLYTYDARSDTLSTVDHLILERRFELGDGRVVPRLIDVVSEAGIPNMISRYKATIASLKASCEAGLGNEILRAADIQRDRCEKLDLAARAHELRGALGHFRSGDYG